MVGDTKMCLQYDFAVLTAIWLLANTRGDAPG